MRRLAWASLLSVLAGGVAAGQSGETIRMRTAGQPDRVLRVVKVDRMSDGHTLVDVKDVKTGDVFTLMDPSFLGQMKPVERTPPPPPEPVTAEAPIPVPPPPVATNVEPPLARIPVGRQSAIVPLRVSPPAPAPSNPGPDPAAPHELPGPVAGYATTPMPPVSDRPAVTLPDDVAASPPAVQPVSLAPVEPVRPYVQNTLAAITPQYGPETVEMRMYREIGPWVADLTRAVRPSVRMDAATALAEGRYGWRDEVKAYLARSAADDPAAVVRAHCISLLTQLGYATGEYRSYLASRATDPNTDVRVAAAIGLARLEPR
jgi:hypothetical protein